MFIIFNINFYKKILQNDVKKDKGKKIRIANNDHHYYAHVFLLIRYDIFFYFIWIKNVIIF